MAPGPAADPPDRDARVAERLRSAADAEGFLSFDRFTEIALYDPAFGYYSNLPELGPAGDFYTAAHVGSLFGRTLARRVAAEYRRLGRPAGFRVVELGAGDGRLAASLLPALNSEPGVAEAVTYVAVERSERLRGRLGQRLAGIPDAPEIHLADSAGADGPFEGVVIANELLDALPARRWIRRGPGWREVGVRWDGGRWEWQERDAVGPTEPGLPRSAAEGTITETSAAGEATIREVADHLAAGAAVFVDYGGTEEELLAGHPRGTVAAVRAHRPVADPLDAPGTADLSTFVNFDRVRMVARRSGLTEEWYGPQREALARWGIEAELQRAVTEAPTTEAGVRVRLAAKNLLFGFENFRALELRAAGSA